MTESTKKTRWPAEWEVHAATWMAFPCREEIWSNGVDVAQIKFAEVANTISEFEPVKMLVSTKHQAFARRKLSSAIEIIPTELDDSWTRDTAPIWVKESGLYKALDFTFNAWGNKFSPYSNDALIAKNVARLCNSEREKVEMVLEGGSIHSNGKGRLLTTKECLLNPNRNPQMSQQAIEKQLADSLGVEEVIWLEKGITGDWDTDGHIDNIACFVSDKTILTQKCSRESENYSIYQDNQRIILDHGCELVEITEPQARYIDGERVPLSYINFYIANDLVLIPRFGVKQDDEAYNVIAELFPERKTISIDANDILVGGGGIHCITMQQPG
ncbi:agmatine deiminase family protein [Aliikangiella sp. G2MR2-5]|uniref:agmatine deiminase family protein n=1 Tax=Aliikangiella sp. G2MR2-5 TaxID=2788943 RepID=UPI0018A96079|nr:agmatine deiminase family protein [Aliikangiella sp. G2MR2-5]